MNIDDAYPWITFFDLIYVLNLYYSWHSWPKNWSDVINIALEPSQNPLNHIRNGMSFPWPNYGGIAGSLLQTPSSPPRKAFGNSSIFIKNCPPKGKNEVASLYTILKFSVRKCFPKIYMKGYEMNYHLPKYLITAFLSILGVFNAIANHNIL